MSAARERAKLSRDELATLVGVSADAIGKWERNANAIQLKNLEKLAAALGCLVGDLLPNSGAGYIADQFEPIAAALSGMDEDEIREQILILAAQARLSRNGIMRRRITEVRENVLTTLRPVPDNARSVASAKTERVRPTIYGVGVAVPSDSNVKPSAAGAATKPGTSGPKAAGKRR